MAEEGDKTQVYIIIAVVVGFIILVLGFMAYSSLRNTVSAADQVGIAHASIGSNTAVGVAEAGRYSHNPNLTTVIEGGTRTQPLPVMQLG